jgi:hypothetical protein
MHELLGEELGLEVRVLVLLTFIEHVLSEEADVVARHGRRASVVQRRIERFGQSACVARAEDMS